MPLRRTPSLLLGPFYPLDVSTSDGADLCDWTGGTPERALELEGAVVTASGRPVVDALIEIWHADPCGHYRHPSCPTVGDVAQGFRGYGALRTGASGNYRFRSVVPGPYAQNGLHRAPHIHVQITARHDRLVTQIFLPQEGNEADHWYQAVSRREAITAQLLSDDGQVCRLRWIAVLTTG
jgi:protocatechuate 3,4-dioxygenase beta subunit